MSLCKCLCRNAMIMSVHVSQLQFCFYAILSFGHHSDLYDTIHNFLYSEVTFYSFIFKFTFTYLFLLHTLESSKLSILTLNVKCIQNKCYELLLHCNIWKQISMSIRKLQQHMSVLVLTCFLPDEWLCYIFWYKTIVASFLHLMVLIWKIFWD